MMHVVPVTLLPGMRIYRFATSGAPDGRLYGAAWWFGVSPHAALAQLAGSEARSLRDVARERLAVPPEWGNAMDMLACASVRRPLSAWSGTPRTARPKDLRMQQYGDAWRPDRSITQLYVPGLSPIRPDGSRGPFISWSEVLQPGAAQQLP